MGYRRFNAEKDWRFCNWIFIIISEWGESVIVFAIFPRNLNDKKIALFLIVGGFYEATTTDTNNNLIKTIFKREAMKIIIISVEQINSICKQFISWTFQLRVHWNRDRQRNCKDIWDDNSDRMNHMQHALGSWSAVELRNAECTHMNWFCWKHKNGYYFIQLFGKFCYLHLIRKKCSHFLTMTLWTEETVSANNTIIMKMIQTKDRKFHFFQLLDDFCLLAYSLRRICK